jgi:hypothetical protein
VLLLDDLQESSQLSYSSKEALENVQANQSQAEVIISDEQKVYFASQKKSAKAMLKPCVPKLSAYKAD